MSTESETKSAGVPAGATHVCLLCGQYWMLAWQMVGGESDPDCGCEDDLRSIAETGPAPTTAAPPAQLGTCELSDEPHEEGEHAEAYGDEPGDCQPCRNWRETETPAPTTAAPAERIIGRVGYDHIVDEGAEVRDVLARAHADRVAREKAAPAEQLSGKALHDETATGDEPWPGGQPGKAADPRPAEVLCDKPSYKHGGSHPQKATCVDPRPAHLTDSEIEKQYPTPPGELTRDEWRQVIPLGIDIVHKLSTLHLRTRPAEPQAPAEPTQEQIEKATAVVANLWGPKSLHVALVGKIAADLAAEAAPLREERDRLAERAKALESQLIGMTGERDDERKISQEWEEKAEAAEKAVAERDARIATLENELRGVLRHVQREAEEHAQAAIKIRAALGAPEGQPPAPQRYLGNDVTCSDAPSSPEEQLSGKELK